jgi:hypothetical protein
MFLSNIPWNRRMVLVSFWRTTSSVPDRAKHPKAEFLVEGARGGNVLDRKADREIPEVMCLSPDDGLSRTRRLPMRVT